MCLWKVIAEESVGGLSSMSGGAVESLGICSLPPLPLPDACSRFSFVGLPLWWCEGTPSKGVCLLHSPANLSHPAHLLPSLCHPPLGAGPVPLTELNPEPGGWGQAEPTHCLCCSCSNKLLSRPGLCVRVQAGSITQLYHVPGCSPGNCKERG